MKILMLFSGGFDSTLASIYLGRREEIALLYFDLIGTEPQLPRAIGEKVSEILGKEIEMYICPFREVVSKILEKVDRRYRQIILRRAMYFASEKISVEMNFQGIGTGEIIGQVSTQTLRSLKVAQRGLSLRILRPIAGLDKEEVISEIKKYGLYELCSKVKEYCNIAGYKVTTWPNPEKVRQEEKKLGEYLEGISWKKYPVREEKEIPFISEIPEGAILVDLREDEKIPGSLDIEELDLEEAKGKKVILICSSGALSMEYAKELRRKGIEAYPLDPKKIPRR